MTSSGHEIRDCWDSKETLLLHEITRQMKTQDTESIFKTYNNIVIKGQIPNCKEKSLNQVQRKLAFMKKFNIQTKKCNNNQ